MDDDGQPKTTSREERDREDERAATYAVVSASPHEFQLTLAPNPGAEDNHGTNRTK
jgi:hypothetical protein